MPSYHEFSNAQLLNAALQVVGTDAARGIPAVGKLVYDTRDSLVYVCTATSPNATLNGGGTWVALGSGSAEPGVAANVQIFSADGTWTKPADVLIVDLHVVGGGGGGGSGRRGSTTTTRGGGGGGGGAGVSWGTLDVSNLASTVAVTVGAGGTGGAAVTADDTDGNAGAAGGNSSFGSYVSAQGGGAGGGGTTAGGTSGANASNGFASGGAGGPGSASSAGAAPTTNAMFTFGGGGGGGLNATNTRTNAVAGASVNQLLIGNISPPFGSADGASGSNGYAAMEPVENFWSQGGGGGASSTLTNAGAGGNGGIGSGGAGGGASSNGVGNSGAGGNGGKGIVIAVAR